LRQRKKQKLRTAYKILPAIVVICLTLGFTYGVAVGKYKYFPHNILNGAVDAVRGLETIYFGERAFYFGEVHGEGGVVSHNTALSSSGLTFMTAFRNEYFQGTLFDMKGKIVHEWKARYSDVWPEAPHLLFQAEDHMIGWHGYHLYPDGDLVFNFSMSNFPDGGGLVRLDKDSNVIWKLAENTHHALKVGEDGLIYALSHTFYPETVPSMSEFGARTLEDFILVVSDDGRVLERISLIQALRLSKYSSLLSLASSSWRDSDPLHVNSIDLLSAGFADQFPQLEPGDMMVSLRHINSIIFIDAKTKVVKLALTGMTDSQHDADYLPNGNVMVFDNAGHSGEGGMTRIIEINPMTGEVVWIYTGDSEHPLANKRAGNQQLLANGNVLITDSESGRIFEVTRSGEIVWDFVNVVMHPDRTDGSERQKGMVTEAKRYTLQSLPFVSAGRPQ
jgi:hypothetical protein